MLIQLSRERIRLSSEGNGFSVGFLFGELAEMQYLCKQLERYESEIRIILRHRRHAGEF